MRKIEEFEIINHGKDHCQYFQGCGTSFTKWHGAVTGCGTNAKEAYDDALGQLCNDGTVDWTSLPKRPKGIRATDRVLSKDNEEMYWYVSIRYCVKGKQ